MSNFTKALFTTLLAGVVLAAAQGCGDSKDPTASTTASDSVNTTVTSTTTTTAPKPPSTQTADASTPTASTPPTASSPAQTTKLDPDDKFDPKDMPKAGDKVAVIDTNYGQIVFKFFGDKAPKTVKNFQTLADKKFYDGTKFHRVIPGFMIQGGDPNTKPGGEANGPPGTGGPGYMVKAEFNDTHHGRGVVSMARSQDPDSAGSQFFICVADAGFLDHHYTAFGKVVKGMNVVDKIVNLPRDAQDNPTPDAAIMNKVRIETWPLK